MFCETNYYSHKTSFMLSQRIIKNATLRPASDDQLTGNGKICMVRIPTAIQNNRIGIMVS